VKGPRFNPQHKVKRIEKKRRGKGGKKKKEERKERRGEERQTCQQQYRTLMKFQNSGVLHFQAESHSFVSYTNGTLFSPLNFTVCS
jgi:hypothetical protein